MELKEQLRKQIQKKQKSGNFQESRYRNQRTVLRVSRLEWICSNWLSMLVSSSQQSQPGGELRWPTLACHVARRGQISFTASTPGLHTGLHGEVVIPQIEIGVLCHRKGECKLSCKITKCPLHVRETFWKAYRMSVPPKYLTEFLCTLKPWLRSLELLDWSL